MSHAGSGKLLGQWLPAFSGLCLSFSWHRRPSFVLQSFRLLTKFAYGINLTAYATVMFSITARRRASERLPSAIGDRMTLWGGGECVTFFFSTTQTILR